MTSDTVDKIDGLLKNERFQDETVKEGQELFLNFFQEQLQKAGIDEPVIAEEEKVQMTLYNVSDCGKNSAGKYALDASGRESYSKLSLRPEYHKNPILLQIGRDLRTLTEKFANSDERRHVKESADQVIIETLSRDRFWAMLHQLFQGGRITRERIIVLFFFCSDVTIRAIKDNGEEWLSMLTQWSLSFIKDQVCSWVKRNGGWKIVLQSGFDKLQQTIMVGACLAFIICSAIYIRKNLI